MPSYIFIGVILLVGVIAMLMLWRAQQEENAQELPCPEPDIPPLNVGIRAHVNSDYDRALPILQHYGERGSLRAQQILASMYYSGHGVQQSEPKFEYWLHLAAENGDKSAKAQLKRIAARKNSSPEGQPGFPGSKKT